MGNYRDILGALVVLQNGMAPHEVVVRALLAASGRAALGATASGTMLLENTVSAAPIESPGTLARLARQGAITDFQRRRIEEALPGLECQEHAQLIEAVLVRQGVEQAQAQAQAQAALAACSADSPLLATAQRYTGRWEALLDARCAEDADLAFCRLALEQGVLTLAQLDEAFKLAAVSTKGRSPVELLVAKGVLLPAAVQQLQRALPAYLQELKRAPEAEVVEKPVAQSGAAKAGGHLGPNRLDSRLRGNDEREVSPFPTTSAPAKSQDADASPAKPRQQIPGYRLLEKLGAGAMGAVFRAEQVENGRIVAIKVLSPELVGADAQFAKRFIREATVLCDMDHPHIIRGLTHGQTERFHYFVMEFAEGLTAGDRLKRRGAFAQDEALRIGDEIASALEYIHARGIVHRDIKPDNIMITTAGPAKLLDLGLVKRETSQQSVLTTDGMVMGTPHYMAPEQVREAHEADIRADIYSLGATLFHMLTGRRPFNGANAMQVIQQHLKQPAPDPRSIQADLSEPCALLVLKMLAKDPKKRYQDPTAFRQALRQARGPHNAPSPEESP